MFCDVCMSAGCVYVCKSSCVLCVGRIVCVSEREDTESEYR